MAKDGKFSKVLVVGIVVANVIFTAVVLAVFVAVGSEPVTLITAWFAFTTGELWLLAGIKKSKLKGGNEDGTKEVV